MQVNNTVSRLHSAALITPLSRHVTLTRTVCVRACDMCVPLQLLEYSLYPTESKPHALSKRMVKSIQLGQMRTVTTKDTTTMTPAPVQKAQPPRVLQLRGIQFLA